MSAGKRWRRVVTRLNTKHRKDQDEDFERRDRAARASRRKVLEKRGLQESNPVFADALEALEWLQTDHQHRRRRLERLATTLKAAAESPARDAGARRALLHAAKRLRAEALASLVPVNIVQVFSRFVRREVTEQKRRKPDEERATRDAWIRNEAAARKQRSPRMSDTQIAGAIAKDWKQEYGGKLSDERIREIAFKKKRSRRK